MLRGRDQLSAATTKEGMVTRTLIAAIRAFHACVIAAYGLDFLSVERARIRCPMTSPRLP